MKKRLKKIKLHKHHKIHLSYLIIIIIILAIGMFLFTRIQSPKVMTERYFYKEIPDVPENFSDDKNQVNEVINSELLDGGCNLGKDIDCIDYELKPNKLTIWASHKLNKLINLSIISLNCAENSTARNLKKGTTRTFVLENCNNLIVGKNNYIDLPLLLYYEDEEGKITIEEGEIQTLINNN